MKMSEKQTIHRLLIDYTHTPSIAKPLTLVEQCLRQCDLIGLYPNKQNEFLERALRKGSLLHRMMFADDTESGKLFNPSRISAESYFLDARDLNRWGYVEDLVTPPEGDLMLARLTMAKIQETLGLIGQNPADSRDAFVVNHDHKTEYCDAIGLVQPPTHGFFMQVINPNTGVIVAHNNTSVLEAAREEKLDVKLPDLRNWSDVAYLQWKSLAAENSDLKCVLRYNITNHATCTIVKLINAGNDIVAKPWPGITYNTTSQEGQALLATPNGSSVAYMLVQHKKQLGHKIVDKVTVFAHNWELMLLFHIVDVVTDETATTDETAATEKTAITS
jgi:hypothetical protein